LQKELEQLPDQVDALESEIASIQQSIAAPGFYQQAHEIVNQQLTLLADKQSMLENLMERWLELEDRHS
jgi:ATP-binding cassette subfamily F protein uup